ncbi:MAG: molybdopterin-dependent oxidoreductase [Blautia sp.]|nr:molybdopterin-dependent oxidoreductase [Blautia sp.]
MKVVNQPIQKKDAMALVTGKPVYTDDLAPKDSLIVKLLRSPYAHAWVEEIHTDIAMKVPGMACILTYKDAAQKRFTLAGQTVPQMSALDHLLIDRHLRYIGDVVAIAAGETEAAVDKALKLIKVKYRVETPILDMHESKDNPVLIHPEEDWSVPIPLGADAKRNLAASQVEEYGDPDSAYENCRYKVEAIYSTKANQQAYMETLRTFSYMDTYGRLVIVSSTQIPFHVRRIVADAVGVPASKVRVIKPRIGGGFGAKQSSLSEMFPAAVTWATGRPAKIVFSRQECMTCSSPRHQMEIRVRIGADDDGIVRSIDMYTLSNAGAYATHSSAVVGLSGHKAIPLYRHLDAYRFAFDVVYTNVQDAGAYRGFGATQGLYALESAIDELAAKIGMDPVALREKNMILEGSVPKGYDGNLSVMRSCSLDKCLAKAKEMIGWNEKYPSRDMGGGKVRGVGAAIAMQGSSIACVDVGGASMKLNEDGSYTLGLGCADMGTGCDTILAQMAAECMDTSVDNVVVFSVDTDISPYDSGSYASATTYATGNAVIVTCEELRRRIRDHGAGMLGKEPEEVDFDGAVVSDGTSSVTLEEIAVHATGGVCEQLQVTKTYSSKVSPPPFMAGIAEVEIDKETGKVELIDYVAVIDCGTPINPNLARVQAEGGLGQGIGMALYEDVQYSDKGKIRNNSFMQYKIPSRLDIGNVRVAFESSYEPTGPFGAKSIGELVIDTPCPAIANAIYNAVGVRIRELPMTPEKVFMGMMNKEV